MPAPTPRGSERGLDTLGTRQRRATLGNAPYDSAAQTHHRARAPGRWQQRAEATMKNALYYGDNLSRLVA